ncbi:MAG: hypothetical protein EA392_05705 [Cryomorphaceae bacterium]|nr:MAG: hypothetical protein EA392_05705 [Cryomorphaceae bacterium]
MLFAAGFFSDCKVNYSFTGADIPADAKTFSVETFTVIAPLADPTYGLTITEELKELILGQSRLDLVVSEGDLQFEGSVTGYNVAPAAIAADEFAEINRLTITIKVSYVNTFEEEKNFDRTFSRFADFPTTQDLQDVEAALIEEINFQLTQDIFDASLGSW